MRNKDAMLENTGVYVCTICGFIYMEISCRKFVRLQSTELEV